MTTEIKSDGASAQAQAKKRVTRPSNDAFTKKLHALEVTLKEKEAALEKAREAVKTSRGPGSTPNEPREKLNAELKTLKAQQAELKTARNKVLDQVRALEDAIGKSIKELQAKRGKVEYKSVDEIDKRVNQLETSIESGNLRLVEEKRYINEISNLKKLRSSFSELGSIQDSIDSNRAKITELKSSLNDTEYKKIGNRIGEVLKELDALRERDQKTYKQRTVLLDARTAAQKERDAARQDIGKLKDDYYGQLRAFNEFMQKEKAEQAEREKAEQKANEKKKHLAEAEAKLEAAKQPAFAAHVATAKSLLAYFDPDYKKELLAASAAEASSSANGNGLTSTKRKGGLNIELPPGAKMMSKPEKNDDNVGSTKSQKKKGRNDNKLRLNITVIEDLSTLNIGVPTSKEDVVNTVQKIKEKIEYYKENEERVTAEKIERAEKELAKVKAELEKKEKEAEEAEAAAASEKKTEDSSAKDKLAEESTEESTEKPTETKSQANEPEATETPAAASAAVIDPTSA